MKNFGSHYNFAALTAFGFARPKGRSLSHIYFYKFYDNKALVRGPTGENPMVACHPLGFWKCPDITAYFLASAGPIFQKKKLKFFRTEFNEPVQPSPTYRVEQAIQRDGRLSGIRSGRRLN
jgi:hypothetical protein